MADYRNLRVYHRSHRLAKHVIKISSRVKRKGHADLATQMKRAAGSVPANIVEGCEYSSRRDFGRFLRYAAGSAAELEYHITLALEIQALYDWHVKAALKQNSDIRKMLKALIKKIEGESA